MLSISPRAMVLALSSWPEAEALALMAGAAAFVSKGDPPRRLLSAIQTLGVHLRTTPSADPQEAPTNGLCLPIVTARAGD